MAFAFNDGRIVTDADIHSNTVWCREIGVPLLRQARDECLGAARKENYHYLKNAVTIFGPGYLIHHNCQSNARYVQALLSEEWGSGSEGFVDSLQVSGVYIFNVRARNPTNQPTNQPQAMSFARHHLIGR